MNRLLTTQEPAPGQVDLAATTRPSTTHGRVAAVRPLTPNLREVTLTCFDDYPLRGGDEFVYVMVSRAPGGISPGYSMDHHLARRPDDPVRGAYYTVRRSRPDVGEIDLWVVAHDHPGSIAAWIADASPGDPIALWGPRRGFEVPAGPARVLLVADESGIAAVAALIESAGTGVRLHVIAEVVDDSYRPHLPNHAGLTVQWVHRGGERPGAINRLLDAVAASVPVAPDAAFGAGESRQISAVRRHLRRTLGMPATDVFMTGYWRAAHDVAGTPATRAAAAAAIMARRGEPDTVRRELDSGDR